MTEPYATVNAISGGPTLWHRYSSPSAPVPNEGTATVDDNDFLEEDGTLLGTFNATYQFEANPFGDGFGMRFNGGGGLGRDAATKPLNPRGTMMVVFRSDGVPVSPNALLAFHFGFDNDVIRIGLDGDGFPFYLMQTNSSNRQFWRLDGTSLDDDAVHSIMVVTAPDAVSDPVFYVDGVDISSSLAFTPDSTIDNNAWASQFDIGSGASRVDLTTAQDPGRIRNPMGNVVMYESLVFDDVVGPADALVIHDLLTGTPPPPPPPVTLFRRRGFRQYPY